MTAVDERPTVPAVLRAVGKASLLALLPAEEARLLAGPVARAQAGVPFSRDEETAAARLLQAVREVLGPPLEQVGVTIPPPPAPVTPRPTRSTRVSTPVVKIVAGPLIAASTPAEIRDVMLSVPGREYSPSRQAWLFPATPAAAATLLAALEPYGPRVSTGVRELAADHAHVLAARAVLADDAPEPEYDGTGHVSMSLWTHQRRFVRFGEDTDALCFAVTMGGGKALRLDTSIATPMGWTTMGALRDGDELFDERGEVCRVVAAHPVRHGRSCYEVVFSDGEAIVADGEHLWWTETRADREAQCRDRRLGRPDRRRGAARTTEEIAATLRVGVRGLINHSVPVAAPLALPGAELPVPPYMLGVWLGDGASRDGTITTADGVELRELLAAEGYRCGEDIGGPDRVESFSVYGLVTQLRGLGVCGDKHVPAAYLRASEKQRRALLAGLLDTDGTVCPHGRVQFDSTRETLARGALELVLSLGYRATMRSKVARFDGRDCGRVWRVSFTSMAPLFRLLRKQQAHGERSTAFSTERNRHRYVVDVRPVPTEPVRCITVDSASQLYLAGRAMVPTHNTGAAIALANKVEAGRVLIVSPNRVRRVWLREVRDRSSVVWHIEDGTRPKLRGRGRIDLEHPERVARATHVLFDCDCGAPVHAFAINYEALAQSVWQRWAPPEPLDLILYDEAHKLRNPQGRIPRKVKGLSVEELKARAARDLPKWSGSGIAGQWVPFARRRIALTGTPMAQYPWDIFGIYRALDPGIFGTVWTPFQERYLKMSRDGTHPTRVKPEMMDEFARKVMSIMYRPVVDLHLPPITDVRRTAVLEAEARRVYDQLDTELWADLTRMLERQRTARRRPVADLDPSGDGDGEVELDGAPAELTARNILSRLLRLQQLTGGTLRTDPVEGPNGMPVPGPEVRVSRAKAELLAEILEDVGCAVPPADAPEGAVPEPVVVFARFTPDLAAIREVAEAAGLRYGEISGNRDDGLDADARMSAGADVVGVQVQAGGTGVDLTRARYAVWYSLGYSVSDYDQARARLHRPGQTRPVVMVHVLVEDTQDEAVYAAIKARRAAVSAVLRAGGVEPDEVGVVEPDPGPAPEVESGLDGAATEVAVRLPWE